MRKSHIDSILVEQAKRRSFIMCLICIIVSIFLFDFSLFFIYFKNNENSYVTYDEKSDILYKVYLKDNDFFENNYLGSNKQYIASLIEKVVADFEYELSFDIAGVDYKYEYEINANINVYDKDTKNVLFDKTENLMAKKSYVANEKEVSIKEKINIDYNYFNDLANKFINVYDLNDAESVLTIVMNISTVGMCDDFKENEENKSTISLAIPLTKKTVAIELSNDLIETENNIMLCESNKLNFIVLLIAIVLVILNLLLFVYLINYEIKTRTIDTIYLKKLRKLLNNYGAYIQELTDDFNFKGYQLIKIRTFEDLLEIRDTIKQPILMKENKEKNSAYFVIPSHFKQLYIYRLKIDEKK